MKKKVEHRPHSSEKSKKRQKAPQTPPPFEDERTGFGILPDRDLKKNLGCG